MADIAQLLQNIMSAIYGEEVRGSIHDAIEAINDDVHDFVRDGMDKTLTSTLLPAEGKAVGDAIAKTLTWKSAADLSPNKDINELTVVGFYFLGAEDRWVNGPEDQSVVYQRVVIVFKGNGSLMHQLYFNSATGVAGFRVYRSNAWQEWQVIAKNSDVQSLNNRALRTRPSVADNSNLDDLYLPGWYIISMTYKVYGSPEDYNQTGRRLVILFTNDNNPEPTNYRIMLYFNHSTGLLAFRNYDHSAGGQVWRDWILLPKLSDVTAIQNKFATDTMSRRSYADDFPSKDAAVTDEVNNDITQWRLWRDLDDMIYPGWYTFANAHKYLHAPVGTPVIENDEVVATYCTGHRVMLVVTNAAGTIWHQIYFQHEGPVLAYRTAWGGSWKAWRVLAPSALPDNDAWMEMDDNTYFPYDDFVPTAQAGSATNTGEKVRIMSYNVQRYNYGTETFIYDAPGKISNYRKVLNAADPDVVCIQEGFPYVDVNYNAGPGKSTVDYLYKPKYPHAYGHGVTWNPIYSKLAIADTGCVRLPTYASATNPNMYRNIQYGVLTLGSKKLLIMSIHTTWSDFEGAGTSAANINARRQEYEGMMRWANGEITLPELTTKAATSAPAHTHVVICMDGNISTDDDRANLTTLAAANNFTLGNGGAIGWVYTHVNASTHEWHSLDEIMVSDNVIIDNIEAWTSWYPKLYSDHCPLIADIVLL